MVTKSELTGSKLLEVHGLRMRRWLHIVCLFHVRVYERFLNNTVDMNHMNRLHKKNVGWNVCMWLFIHRSKNFASLLSGMILDRYQQTMQWITIGYPFLSASSR